MRSHHDTTISSPHWRVPSGSRDARPVVLVAVDPSDAPLYASGPFVRVLATSTGDAVRVIEREHPSLIAVDLDLPDLDGLAVCRAACPAGEGGALVLVTTGTVERVPAALKIGCHAVLLKPFAPNLIAARMARLLREIAELPPHDERGTNRIWPDTRCPTCGAPGATSFDFASYRRMWYACLTCEGVWLGKRREQLS